MKEKIVKVKSILLNNKKIAENYFFMTVLSVLNSFFYLLIYPFVIRKLGTENYGLYVFCLSIVNYFVTFINFGFDMPGVKNIALNQNNMVEKVKTISGIFTAKVYLVILSIIIVIAITCFIPILRKNSLIIYICFLQTFNSVLFPQWYFQGMQKMNVVTYIQIASRVLSLPFIFIFIRSSNDLLIFALIISLSGFLGSLIAAYIIYSKEKIKIYWIKKNDLKFWLKEGLPFFWTNSSATIKQQSITVIIGSLFNMRDVAIYDLAYKVITIPMVIYGSINGSLFPKLVNDRRKNVIKRIFLYEFILGLIAIIAVIFFGRFIVIFLGGHDLLAAYPVAIALSFGIWTFLLVGACISFIFVPANRYYLATKNQLISFFFFFILLLIGLIIYKNIIIIALSWAIAGCFEIIYCYILIKKNNLF